MRVMTILGTRPELIRLSLVLRRLVDAGLEHHLVHTGQNHDARLSDIFVEELGIPEPDTYLGVRSATVGAQIGQIIAGTEAALLEWRPDAVLILGDTYSGLAAIAAAHHQIPIFHMESGNRCRDWTVPEERNRLLIDHMSDFLLPYTDRARENLLAEGLPSDRIFVSGNPITEIIDHFKPLWEASDVLERLALDEGRYVLVTAHRQESVDVPARLRVICEGLGAVAAELDLPVIWSVHPRTRLRLGESGIELDPRIQLHEPFAFSDFVRLESSAACVITDSGTVQEECSLFKIPTVTCRDTTERQETVECGSNVLSGVQDPARLLGCVQAMTAGARNWVSPYEGPMHRDVADKVVKYMVGHADARSAAPGRPTP
jgi:UDP-N-acetylglucosamine 2-epimerase (non-hydrolysing)